MKLVTIGRDNSCDIVINDPRVSRVHANIFQDNGMYTYRDTSTNGTKVNGVILCRSDMNIKLGDSVLLAGIVPLPWNKVQNLLPLESEQPYSPNYTGNQMNNNRKGPELPACLRKWNWGAFYFSWLWAVCNGIYWPLIVLIPYVGWLASPVVAIILGINGNEWAWEKKYWHNIDHFTRNQHNWAMAALWLFLGSIGLGIWVTAIIIGTVNF